MVGVAAVSSLEAVGTCLGTPVLTGGGLLPAEGAVPGLDAVGVFPEVAAFPVVAVVVVLKEEEAVFPGTLREALGICKVPVTLPPPPAAATGAVAGLVLVLKAGFRGLVLMAEAAGILLADLVPAPASGREVAGLVGVVLEREEALGDEERLYFGFTGRNPLVDLLNLSVTGDLVFVGVLEATDVPVT